MKLIAITGGIGSGKSVVARLVQVMGHEVYDCDSRAKALYREDAGLAAEVADLLGDYVLAEDGSLDFRKMAEKLFGSRALMEQLEAIVHPAVAQDFLRWAEQQAADIVILESAILLEKPFFDNFANFVITVSAPEEVRIERVMRRDGISREQVQSRLASQWTDARREARADMTLFTDDRTPVLPQILELIENLKIKENGNRS